MIRLNFHIHRTVENGEKKEEIIDLQFEQKHANKKRRDFTP